MKLPYLLFAFVLTTANCHISSSQENRNDIIEKVRLDQKGFDRMRTVHSNWYIHSVKALIGQLGKDVYEKLDRADRKTLYKCLNKIKDSKDLVDSARCIVVAKDSLDSKPIRLSKEEIKHVQDGESEGYRSIMTMKSDSPNKEIATIGRPLIIRKIGKKQSKLMRLRKILKELEKKEKSEKYKLLKSNFMRYRRRRAKRSPYRLVTDMTSKSDGSEGFYVKKMEKMPNLKVADKSVIEKVVNMIRLLINKKEEAEKRKKWTDSYKKLLQVKKTMDIRAKEKGAKIYDMRMLDLVLGHEQPSSHSEEAQKEFIPPIVREAYQLIGTIENSGKHVQKNANIKFLSPRFASVMPDKSDVKGSLSPSILPFYNDDTEQQILPIPKLLEITGLQGKDRELVMELIMDISGARDTIDDAIKVLQNMNFFGLDGELVEVTERIEQNFNELKKSFNNRQTLDMNRRGFTFLETNQIEDLYTKQGVRLDLQDGFNLENYRNQTNEERENSLWDKVRLIAQNSTANGRSKRALVSVLNPTVLSPYMFSPIYGLSVLGPTVLSPSLFSPLILNPAVLSPYVLSPGVGMPFILSPYLLSPYVLSPLVFAPFILTPYVLSPNVINPYVLSPLILSPTVLCPDVLSPMVLGGAILSPGVASPSILSKSVLMATVLSPSILS